MSDLRLKLAALLEEEEGNPTALVECMRIMAGGLYRQTETINDLIFAHVLGVCVLSGLEKIATERGDDELLRNEIRRMNQFFYKADLQMNTNKGA